MTENAITNYNGNSALEVAGAAASRTAARYAFAEFQSRKADNTLAVHRRALAAFADFLRATESDHKASAEGLYSDPANWKGVTWGLVEAFRNWQVGRGDAINSVNLRLSVVKTYAKLAMKTGVIDPAEYTKIRAVAGYSPKEGKRINEARGVARRGTKKEAATRITDSQAAALKTHPDTPQGRRDALLMCLLLDHGLRVGEVAGLTVGAFDLQAGVITFDRPKVDLTQTHKLTADTLRAARAWFDSGDVSAMNSAPVLRASRKGGELTTAGMSERAIKKRVAALGAALGIDRLSPHDCRHYWATQWAHKVDPFRLKEAGGWKSYSTVDRYVEASKIANEGMA